MHWKTKITFYLSVIFLLISSPAYANSTMFFGVYSTMAPGAVALATWGIAGILIITIESWFFVRYWNYSWSNAVSFAIGINFASTVIGGFISVLMFSSSCFLLPAFVLVPYLAWVACRHKPPGWFWKLMLPMFIVGGLVAGTISNLAEPLSKILLFLAIEVSLLYSFAITVMIESSIGSFFNRESNYWRTITLANVASYALLVFLFPFFAPNPYTYTGTWALKHALHIRSSDLVKHDSQKAIEFLHLRRSTTSYLIGLSKSNPSPRNYDAEFEIEFLIRETWSDFFFTEHFDNIQDVINDTMSVPTLTSEALEKLKWFKKYYEFAKPVFENISENDQEGFNQTYRIWAAWFKNNTYRDEDNKHIAEMLIPLKVVKDSIRGNHDDENSKLVIPTDENTDKEGESGK